MRRPVVFLVLGVIAGTAGGYWYARLPASTSTPSIAAAFVASAVERKILYYRDPSGAPYWSAGPKKDANGRDYLPVYEDEEVSFDPRSKKPPQAASGVRRILYYRNPMGLPDTSPVPKKDPMGMDYIPVYEGEDQADGKTIKVSLDKIQRSGVRTEMVQKRVIDVPVRAVGTVMHDESLMTVVAMRSEGYIEELFVSKTGEHVHAGQPLFRVYSPDIQKAQTDLLFLSGQDGTAQRLRNLGVPESHVRKVLETRSNLQTVDWPAPATGDVIVKNVINGQRVRSGDELFRIADHTHLWIIADVAETDLPAIEIDAEIQRIGERAGERFARNARGPVAFLRQITMDQIEVEPAVVGTDFKCHGRGCLERWAAGVVSWRAISLRPQAS